MTFHDLNQHIGLRNFYQNGWFQSFFNLCQSKEKIGPNDLPSHFITKKHMDRKSELFSIKTEPVGCYGKSFKASSLERKKVHYTAMIPFYFTGAKQEFDALLLLVDQIKNEAFKGLVEESYSRLEVVILLNHPRVTLASKSRCRKSTEQLQALSEKLKKRLEQMPFRVHLLYTMWQPKFSKAQKIDCFDPCEASIGTSTTRPALHFFSAMIDAATASKFEKTIKVQDLFHQYYMSQLSSVVPYSNLRQAIYDSSPVQQRMQLLEKQHHYLISLDGDSISLAPDGAKGLVFHLDACLDKKKVDYLSFGYDFKPDAPYISKLACKIDMIVREQTAAMKLGVYYPEPCSAFSAKCLINYTAQGLHCLENRHLIQSMEKEAAKLGKPLKSLFKVTPAVVTKQAPRMHPKEQVHPTQYKRKLLTEQTSMKKLCTLSQSHYKRRIFAENIYAHLPSPFRYSSPEISKKMQAAIQNLFAAYDINQRIYSAQQRGKQTDEILDEIQHQIDINPVKLDQRKTLKTFLASTSQLSDDPILKDERTGVLSAQYPKLIEARKTLKEMGLPTEWVRKIETACCNAHEAVGKLLIEEFAHSD